MRTRTGERDKRGRRVKQRARGQQPRVSEWPRTGAAGRRRARRSHSSRTERSRCQKGEVVIHRDGKDARQRQFRHQQRRGHGANPHQNRSISASRSRIRASRSSSAESTGTPFAPARHASTISAMGGRARARCEVAVKVARAACILWAIGTTGVSGHDSSATFKSGCRPRRAERRGREQPAAVRQRPDGRQLRGLRRRRPAGAARTSPPASCRSTWRFSSTRPASMHDKLATAQQAAVGFVSALRPTDRAARHGYQGLLRGSRRRCRTI